MVDSVHLIRHGQSTFNLAYAETGVDPMHIDARLTPTGENQVKMLAQVLRQHDYDLIVTSPFTRAIQTTMGVFKGRKTPILVEAGHREWLEASCDVGRPVAELAVEFPHLDFKHIPDVWWHQGPTNSAGLPLEPREVFMQRVQGFAAWLRARPEDRIAVVGHGTFFSQLCGRFLANCEMAPWDPRKNP